MTRGSEPAQPAGPPRVLLAEDDRFFRRTLSGMLTARGFHVESVDDGQQALDRIRQGGIDLVLLDNVMPRLSGVECCRILKSMTREDFLPVILLTARNDVESRVEGLRVGADDYIGKPCDECELIARVQNMLNIKRAHDEVLRSKRRLEKLAIQDELTGLYNYRYLQRRLGDEFKRAQRYRYPLACAMLDVDHFKQLNDTHGHDTGDAILAQLGGRVREAVRDVDVVARYGGEEFLLVLPNTHFAGALTVADRVWRSVGKQPFVHAGASHHVTVSVGVALYPSRDIKTKDQLLKAADEALYAAKGDGRDRICMFQQQGYIYRPATREMWSEAPPQ